ncbi:S-adenosyl-l-methionine hydroxide adenosyltransferase family protein [Staphylococcus simulans]|uniref:DNA-directed RNA polymerase subunit delta n=1 Tax=Staphylococcus simulans UMC-CNS-990 TaxID=1405498 RepID=A0ABN0PFY6_STASI|nr:S-adenosyl-l-methionine hydroxide adenosyltransferase family protein [Staphylococcus simulans]ERS94608.1 DNA-directed RNA polymerase subunit delta [Staphylococcus simulans UMC-CNS-990]MCE5147975.1 S-adenosyl-l-methionine hydroxide adenosyltransferase family protein [Staphylococcus simulans]MDU0420614.1 S-adenosyl-l-methionine hydroxide adenosyltransferase family protein [Staphylococcus simulans]MDU0467349.1 S-adenosyl-l-methionine hydroxide adenosyltransferase family protein [Staphylococcus 
MSNNLILQSDFGIEDGAVSAMKGVARMVSDNIFISDLTHDIPPYDIWVASYRLYQTVKYWPKGTVFVSVVDPGVGSDRRSIACLTKTGHYIITPDNGSLTHILHYEGIESVIAIDEVKSRLPHSEESHTFHGRDIYAYNGARLAASQIEFEDLGQSIDLDSIKQLPINDSRQEGDTLIGYIDVLDIRFGSLWTNIPLSYFKENDIHHGDNLIVTIYNRENKVYQNIMKFVRSFADVNIGEPLVYINSLVNIGVAVNQNSFSKLYHIGTGNDWRIEITKGPTF